MAVPEPEPYILTWTTPPNRDGVTQDIVLNPPDEGYFALKSIAGLGVAPRDVNTSANPDGGVTIDGVRYTGRDLVIPMRVRDLEDHEGFLAKWRMIGEGFAKTARYGLGTLRVDRPGGTSRLIKGVYKSGWEGEPGDGAWTEDTCAVTLLCPDPFFRDVEPTVLERTSEALVDYLNPYPNIGSGQVLGATTLNNPGHVDVWPDWKITGPMTSLTATNNTRGQSFTLTYALAAGEVLTMSSRPVQVRGPLGQNVFNALNFPTGRPWRLDAEYNSSVTFAASGATAATKVELSFSPGYETA